MTDQGETVFKARRSVGKLWIFLVGFGIFIPIGMVIFLLTGEKAGLAFAAFGLLPDFYILYRILAPGSIYRVGIEGIYLRHGSSKRWITSEELRGAAILSEEQAKEILNRYLAPSIQSERSLDLKGWYRSNYAYGNFIRFCTVPIVQETKSVGSSLNITSFKNLTSGVFILLKLQNGEEFLLSPEDGNAFFRGLSTNFRLADTTPSSSYAPENDRDWQNRSRKRRKWYYIYAFGTFFIVLTIVMVNFVIPALGRSPGGAGDTERAGDAGGSGGGQAAVDERLPEPGWVDGNTFRVVIHLEAELGGPGAESSGTEGQEERRHELIHSVAEGYIYSLTGQVLGYYIREKGLDPTEEEYGSMEDVVAELMGGIEPQVVSTDYNEDFTAVQVVLTVGEENLRNRLWDSLEK